MPGSIDGLPTYLVLFLAGALATEVWRWLGLAVGGRIDVTGGLFQWVRAVATALVAGMVARMVLFPVGALADVGIALRLLAFCGGLALFFLARRNLAVGVAGGAAMLIATQLVVR